MTVFVGVDYHKRYRFGTIVDDQGNVLRQGRFCNTEEFLREFLGKHAGSDCHAVVETTRNWHVMYDLLEKLSGRVV